MKLNQVTFPVMEPLTYISLREGALCHYENANICLFIHFMAYLILMNGAKVHSKATDKKHNVYSRYLQVTLQVFKLDDLFRYWRNWQQYVNKWQV